MRGGLTPWVCSNTGATRLFRHRWARYAPILAAVINKQRLTYEFGPARLPGTFPSCSLGSLILASLLPIIHRRQRPSRSPAVSARPISVPLPAEGSRASAADSSAVPSRDAWESTCACEHGPSRSCFASRLPSCLLPPLRCEGAGRTKGDTWPPFLGQPVTVQISAELYLEVYEMLS